MRDEYLDCTKFKGLPLTGLPANKLPRAIPFEQVVSTDGYLGQLGTADTISTSGDVTKVAASRVVKSSMNFGTGLYVCV